MLGLNCLLFAKLKSHSLKYSSGPEGTGELDEQAISIVEKIVITKRNIKIDMHLCFCICAPLVCNHDIGANRLFY